ncbi:hypothetical protein SLNWT_0994 [Streptomyces albus]|uniref:Uncharacterized protein n=1 Tax=Streptomyces albus (strain ATCC 21838 / DSM 41398 / FERM P-419 / JCM 4703 / NBRC 107858) TaxID=1081613 RepID=A0A0B5EQ26_STRA4|nr:hypothetical protein SLNWT_0994 [Streptomyces albus]AOU75686.1 hypothetical protein SLNHY_0995 [Streptomyces albus]AYN31488.1 hypothetical protein DUI70_0985 [Streptomyces albus]
MDPRDLRRGPPGAMPGGPRLRGLGGSGAPGPQESARSVGGLSVRP